MRIGIFTDAYEPHVSGVTTSITMLKKGLEKLGNEVFIVTANLYGKGFFYEEDKKIINIPGIKTGIYETKLTPLYSHKAMKIIKSWNLDIIHSQTEFAIGYFSRIVAKKLSIPVVHTYHTMYEDYVYYVTHGHFDKFSKNLVKKLTKYYCEKKCNECIVPTQKIKDLFENKYNITNNVSIIPTGIDTEKFLLTDEKQKEITTLKKELKIKNSDFIIGSVGRIAKEKSYDKMILASKPLLEKNNNLKLLIVGGGPELDNLKKLVDNENLQKSVIFTGLVDYQKIDLYYSLMNIMTSFSKTETQGLTIIEGLASSLPVVCVNDDSFKITIKQNYNGILFDNDNEYQKAIENLFKNKEEYQKMCTNARESIYKYSKEAFAESCIKIYQRAINNYSKK